MSQQIEPTATAPEQDGCYGRAMHSMAEIVFRLCSDAEGNRELALRAYKLTQGLLGLIDEVVDRQLAVVRDIAAHPANDDVRALAQSHADTVDAIRQNIIRSSARLEWVMQLKGHVPMAAGCA